MDQINKTGEKIFIISRYFLIQLFLNSKFLALSKELAHHLRDSD